MKKDKLSIIANRKTKSMVEKTAAMIFCGCSVVSIVSVVFITAFMFYKGVPTFFEVGFGEILFSTDWAPTASDPSYGILYIILTSIIGVTMAVILAVPIGILTAVNLAEIAKPKTRGLVKGAVELLAGIPSIVYGMIGYMVLNPWMYKLEKLIYSGDSSHTFTGGANLLSAVIVLAIMILPTLINITETALQAVPDDFRKSSYALGASKMQTIFKVVLPTAKTGIASAIVLGVGRAIGEAMAICVVAGNVVNFPWPFNSVRFLTTAIVTDMKYATGTHMSVLYAIALVLFVFIMVINIILTTIIKKGDLHD
ncbi:phosphate ABC transporter permease subunit PstC [Tannockella kyphosi]|uniref:phosphate ABC transporter permease subunit PstC n=1 Tax=Tannockella kyphosi TaxID=2899121 RepID=UPI002010E840|nr:phosphate ABC transporter permease subunit PstC [Tannockella kyphosi]